MRRVTFSYTNWKWKSIHFEISLYLQRSEPEKSYDPSEYHINKVLLTIYKIIAPNYFFAILNALFFMYHCWGFPGGSEGKASAAMRETRIPSLGQEDPLEKEMATHSSILARRIPWAEEPGKLQSMGSQRVKHNWVTWAHLQIVLT